MGRSGSWQDSGFSCNAISRLYGVVFRISCMIIGFYTRRSSVRLPAALDLYGHSRNSIIVSPCSFVKYLKSLSAPKLCESLGILDLWKKVFVRYCMSQTALPGLYHYLRPSTLTYRFPLCLSPIPFVTEWRLFLLLIDPPIEFSESLDRSIFARFVRRKKKRSGLPYFLDSRWDPSQGPSQVSYHSHLSSQLLWILYHSSPFCVYPLT